MLPPEDQPAYIASSIFNNTSDILNISLALGFIILVIFLSVAIIYLILVLRDINKITSTVKDTTDQVSNYILKPISLASKLVMNLKPIIEMIERKVKQRTATKKKKK